MSTRLIGRRASAVAMAGVAAVALTPLLAGCSEVVFAVAGAVVRAQAEPSASPVLPSPSAGGGIDGDLSVGYLTVGDCFDEHDQGMAAEGEAIYSVLLIRCDDPHTFEVYAEEDLGTLHFPEEVSPTGRYPGDDEIARAAEETCYDAFDDFVGAAYEDSPLEFWFYTPQSLSWEHGDRMVTCFVGDPGVTVTGSAEGSGLPTS